MESFVDFVQLSFAITATKLKRTAVLSYTVHAMLLDGSDRRKHGLPDNASELGEFLTACCTLEPLQEGTENE